MNSKRNNNSLANKNKTNSYLVNSQKSYYLRMSVDTVSIDPQLTGNIPAKEKKNLLQNLKLNLPLKTRSINNQNLQIIQSLIHKKQWNATQQAFSLFITDLNKLNIVLSKLILVAPLTKWLYAIIEENFITCTTLHLRKYLIFQNSHDTIDEISASFDATDILLESSKIINNNPILFISRFATKTFIANHNFLASYSNQLIKKLTQNLIVTLNVHQLQLEKKYARLIANNH